MKPIDILKYNSKLLKLLFILLLVYSILLCIVIFLKQSIEVIVVLSLLYLILIFITIYFIKYRIIVYSDRLIIIGLFSSKEFLYENCIINEEASIRIFNNEYKEQIRISLFIDKKSTILKTYREYCRKNKVEKFKINNIIKYNYYVRNFSIFGIIFSFILFLLAGLVLYLYVKKVYCDYKMLMFFAIFGVVINSISLIGFLSYINFKIYIYEDKVVIYNMFKREKTYVKDKVTFEDKDKFIILYLGEKKKKVLLYYFLDNDYALYQLLIMKQQEH